MSRAHHAGRDRDMLLFDFDATEQCHCDTTNGMLYETIADSRLQVAFILSVASPSTMQPIQQGRNLMRKYKITTTMNWSTIAVAAVFMSYGFAHSSYAQTPVQNAHVCVEDVAWKDNTSGLTGHSQLGTSNVSGATIEDAASQCHQNTRTAFGNNNAWSNVNQICQNTNGRTFASPINVTVGAFDQFQDMPGNWNRVENYTVDCSLQGNVPLP